MGEIPKGKRACSLKLRVVIRMKVSRFAKDSVEEDRGVLCITMENVGKYLRYIIYAGAVCQAASILFRQPKDFVSFRYEALHQLPTATLIMTLPKRLYRDVGSDDRIGHRILYRVCVGMPKLRSVWYNTNVFSMPQTFLTQITICQSRNANFNRQ